MNKFNSFVNCIESKNESENEKFCRTILSSRRKLNEISVVVDSYRVFFEVIFIENKLFDNCSIKNEIANDSTMQFKKSLHQPLAKSTVFVNCTANKNNIFNRFFFLINSKSFICFYFVYTYVNAISSLIFYLLFTSLFQFHFLFIIFFAFRFSSQNGLLTRTTNEFNFVLIDCTFFFFSFFVCTASAVVHCFIFVFISGIDMFVPLASKRTE